VYRYLTLTPFGVSPSAGLRLPPGDPMPPTDEQDSARRDMAARAKQAVEEDEELARQCRDLMACIQAIRDASSPPHPEAGETTGPGVIPRARGASG
jgi:hypothetical protein